MAGAGERGFGALVTTEVRHVDLGTFGARSLRGRVEHRRLRLAAGRRAGFSLTLGRLRAVAVEVTEPGRAYEVPIPAVEDPRVRALRRTLVLWAGALVVSWIVDRRRSSRHAPLEAA
jgi:hypothetical protein